LRGDGSTYAPGDRGDERQENFQYRGSVVPLALCAAVAAGGCSAAWQAPRFTAKVWTSSGTPRVASRGRL
jgi:hypothetical protein